MSDQKKDITVGIIDEPNPGNSDDDKLGIQRHATPKLISKMIWLLVGKIYDTR